MIKIGLTISVVLLVILIVTDLWKVIAVYSISFITQAASLVGVTQQERITPPPISVDTKCPPETNGLDTPSLINAAFRCKEISESQRILYLQYALGDPEKLPSKYKGNVRWDGTSVGLLLQEVTNSEEKMCRLSSFTQKEISRISGTSTYDCLFPVPGSTENTYWTETTYPNNNSFFIGSNEIEIPNSQTIDYHGIILLSPKKDKVCFEWGSSGHWGYTIGEITPKLLNVLAEGQQYSYCKRWLDNDRIIIEEKPYNTAKHEDNFYIFDTRTASKQLVPNDSNL